MPFDTPRDQCDEVPAANRLRLRVKDITAGALVFKGLSSKCSGAGTLTTIWQVDRAYENQAP
jgi:hypothetical protein